MKYFLIKLLTFFIILLLLDKALYFVMFYIADSQYDKRLELLVTNKIEAETIVLGSSRAARDVLAENLEEKLNTTAYNLGYPGSNIEFHTYLLEKILKHSPDTKKIILVVDDMHEFINSNLDFRMDTLYPLVKYDEINKDVVEKHGKSLFVSNLLYSYRIRENFPKELFNKFLLRKRKCVKCLIHSRGSMPISAKSESWEQLIYENDLKIYSPDIESKLLKKSFYTLLEQSKKGNIKLLFVFPPNLKSLNKSFVRYFLRTVNETYPTYIYDESRITYSNKHYFYDESHLNDRGAAIFTDELAEYMKKIEF